MLVLSRKPGEAICIGSDIQVSVLGIRGNQVRLGLTAPRRIPVNRGEIQRQIDAAAAERCTKDSATDAESA